jgi:signal peptidase I
MSRRRRRGLVLVALGGTPLVLLVVFLLPARAGGSTHYLRVRGASMLPALRAGDFVITRPRAVYRTGEIAAYHSPVFHGFLVLHRITRVQAGRYTFRGDANDSPDSEPVGRRSIVGARWLRIPNVWVRPAEIGAAAVVTVLATLLCAGLVLTLSAGSGAARG